MKTAKSFENVSEGINYVLVSELKEINIGFEATKTGEVVYCIYERQEVKRFLRSKKIVWKPLYRFKKDHLIDAIKHLNNLQNFKGSIYEEVAPARS